MLVTPVDYLEDLGQIWTSWGGVWGGKSDPVHFQLPGAPTPALLAQAKGGIASFLEDPYLYAAEKQAALPWYVSFFLPWQLDLYNQFEWIRPLINPAWGLRRIQKFMEDVGLAIYQQNNP